MYFTLWSACAVKLKSIHHHFTGRCQKTKSRWREWTSPHEVYPNVLQNINYLQIFILVWRLKSDLRPFKRVLISSTICFVITIRYSTHNMSAKTTHAFRHKMSAVSQSSACVSAPGDLDTLHFLKSYRIKTIQSRLVLLKNTAGEQLLFTWGC